jgi:hypothetical protein
VILPTRRKTSLQESDIKQELKKTENLKETETTALEKPVKSIESKADEVSAPIVSPKVESPEDKRQEDVIPKSLPSYPVHTPDPFIDIEEETTIGKQTLAQEKQTNIDRPATTAAKPPMPNIKRPLPQEKEKLTGNKTKIIAFGLIALVVIIATGVYVLSLSAPGIPKSVQYSSFLSNSSQGNFLGLDVKNQHGIGCDVEMVLPPNIDKSISSRGGVITISHTGNTSIKLNSSSDASVRLYLSRNWTSIPVTLRLTIPKGYDSALAVHGKDYDIKRKDDKIILSFDCTQEGVSFEQNNTPKRR